MFKLHTKWKQLEIWKPWLEHYSTWAQNSKQQQHDVSKGSTFLLQISEWERSAGMSPRQRFFRLNFRPVKLKYYRCFAHLLDWFASLIASCFLAGGFFILSFPLSQQLTQNKKEKAKAKPSLYHEAKKNRSFHTNYDSNHTTTNKRSPAKNNHLHLSCFL